MSPQTSLFVLASPRNPVYNTVVTRARQGTRQQIAQSRSVLQLEARFNPSHESTDCTIVTQWLHRSAILTCRDWLHCLRARVCLHIQLRTNVLINCNSINSVIFTLT